jgi:aspartate/methionine/tyrosine aminotransferase
MIFDTHRVKVVPVEFEDADPFSADDKTIEAYKNAFYSSNYDGTKVKAILLCNPHNPTGRCYVRRTAPFEIQFSSELNRGLLLVIDQSGA